MSSRSSKRRRYSNIKSLLVNDLNNINLISANLNEDIRSANEDFGLFFKSMEDRQTELFARTIGIEEKYMKLFQVLTGNQNVSDGQSSQQENEAVQSYLGREQRFVEDTKVSLLGHVKQFRELLEEMLKWFSTFEAHWKKNLNDWLTKAGEMEENRAKLSAGLVDFSHNI